MDGPIRIVNAATLVCLRRSLQAPGTAAAASTAASPSWDVLLGQSEVKNWLRSTPEATRVMRYPGEWKFPGGVVDHGDTSLEATALRELEEEFMGLQVPRSSPIYFLNAKLTRPIQNRRHRMFSFVVLQEENESWLNDDALRRVNETLRMKREDFDANLASGRYWSLPESEKMALSPEIHRVQWFPMDQAIAFLKASLSDPRTPLDSWQQGEFERYGIARRDPMYITMRVLLDIAEFSSQDALIAFARQQHAPPLSSHL